METAAPELNPDRKGDPLYTHGKVRSKKRKLAPPRKAYAIRLSKDEHQKLKERAKAAGFDNISEFVRHHHAGTKEKEVQKPVPEIAQLVAEIRAIGNNWNQVARHLNEHIRLGLLTEEQIERAIIARDWLAVSLDSLASKYR